MHKFSRSREVDDSFSPSFVSNFVNVCVFSQIVRRDEIMFLPSMAYMY